MTSKNSFLVRLFENGKRRLWLGVIAILLFVVAIPIYTAMCISLIQAMEEGIGYALMQKQLYDQMEQMFTFNGSMAFWGSCFAVLSGIQGFSYLYDRSKIDFYHSKPVRTSQRFLTIWLNGVLVYVIPFILGNIINVLLVAASGVLDMTLILSLCEAIVLSIGFYLCVYSITILAVMLTGKTLITLMGVCVFLFYEMAVRAFITGLCSFSFHFFYGYDGTNDWYLPLLSPFRMLSLYWDEKMGPAMAFVQLIIFAAAVLALAYWCYKKRPSELAGSAMTFQGIKPVIKIGISVPVALVAGVATAGLMEYSPLDGTGSPFFPILLGTIFVILTNALIQVLFESDIRGMFHKKRHIVISAALALIIMVVFRYDLIGYDNRIPDIDKIESVSIITGTSQRYSRYYYDEDMKQLTKEEYTDKYMHLTGEDAENVRNLALLSIEQYQKYPNRHAFYDANEEYAHVVYKFRLKNGNIVAREIPVHLRDSAAQELIGKIEASEDFIRTNEPAMSDYLLAAVESGKYKIDATWGNEMNAQKLTTKQVRELLKLYREDLLQDSYTVRSSELPIGEIELYLDMQISYGNHLDLTVYPSFTNCVAYLKENGFETEEYIDMANVDRIVVSRYYETEETNILEETTIGFEEAVAVETTGETFTADYVDSRKIAEIIDNAYPLSLEWEYWYHESPYDDTEYHISVYFKEGTDYFEEYGSVSDFYFLKDQIPDFVLEDLPKEAPPKRN